MPPPVLISAIVTTTRRTFDVRTRLYSRGYLLGCQENSRSGGVVSYHRGCGRLFGAYAKNVYGRQRGPLRKRNTGHGTFSHTNGEYSGFGAIWDHREQPCLFGVVFLRSGWMEIPVRLVRALFLLFSFSSRYCTPLWFAGHVVFCSNVLFVCSVVCLFMGWRAETVFIVWLFSRISYSTPSTMFMKICSTPIHSVTRKISSKLNSSYGRIHE